jgi:hypothetical protein
MVECQVDGGRHLGRRRRKDPAEAHCGISEQGARLPFNETAGGMGSAVGMGGQLVEGGRVGHRLVPTHAPEQDRHVRGEAIEFPAPELVATGPARIVPALGDERPLGIVSRECRAHALEHLGRR